MSNRFLTGIINDIKYNFSGYQLIYLRFGEHESMKQICLTISEDSAIVSE